MALTTYKKWDVVLVDLNPTKGSEMAKVRPCVIVSPIAVNTYMNTIIVVPFTSQPKGYPFRISTLHKGMVGELCFDHMKSVDKTRIVKVEGTLDKALRNAVNALMVDFFSE